MTTDTLEKLEKEHAEMGETIKRMKEEKNKILEPWVPKEGEKCSILFSGGDVSEFEYHREDWGGELERGLIFKTRQEALDFDRRCIIQTKLQRLADKMWAKSGEVLDWGDDSQRKLYVCYDYKHMCFVWVGAYYCNSEQTVFPRGTEISDITAEIPEADLEFLWRNNNGNA
jgi:hypothetical protein